MTMAKTVTPKPMPTTGMPDRSDPPQLPMVTKKGVSSAGTTKINPGRPGGSK
jgi:hypothetical protein